MSVRVHKSVLKVEMEGGRVIKAEVHPDDDWVLVEGARDMTIVFGFRAQDQPGAHAVTDWKPNDAIRIRMKRNLGEEIEIFMDRERGGKWYAGDRNPTLRIRFDSAFCGDEVRKIRIIASGGDLERPIQIAEVPLLPPAKLGEK